MAIEQNQSIPVSPQTGDNTPNVQPWALNAGTQTTPTTGEMATGWTPTVMPDYHVANAIEGVRWQWDSRNACNGFFVQRATEQVAATSVAAGDTLRVTFDGTNIDHTVTTPEAGDALLLWSNYAAEWRLCPLRNVIDAYGESGGMFLCYRNPGQQYPSPVTVSTVSGSAVMSVTDVIGGAGASILTTSYPSGAGNNPLLHGAESEDGDATKLHWYGYDGAGALRAGSFGGGTADPGAVGAGSAGFGLNSTAGNFGLAAGANTQAGAYGVAAGNATAAPDYALAFGDKATTDRQGALVHSSGFLGSNNDKSQLITVHAAALVAAGDTTELQPVNMPAGSHLLTIDDNCFYAGELTVLAQYANQYWSIKFLAETFGPSIVAITCITQAGGNPVLRYGTAGSGLPMVNSTSSTSGLVLNIAGSPGSYYLTLTWNNSTGSSQNITARLEITQNAAHT